MSYCSVLDGERSTNLCWYILDVLAGVQFVEQGGRVRVLVVTVKQEGEGGLHPPRV